MCKRSQRRVSFRKHTATREHSEFSVYPLFQLLTGNKLQIVSFSRLGIVKPSQRWKSHSSVFVVISVFLLLDQFSSYPLIKFPSPSWGQSNFDISPNLLSAFRFVCSLCVKTRTQPHKGWLKAIFYIIFSSKICCFFFTFIMAAVNTSFYWTKRKIKTWKIGLRLVNRSMPLSAVFVIYKMKIRRKYCDFSARVGHWKIALWKEVGESYRKCTQHKIF